MRTNSELANTIEIACRQIVESGSPPPVLPQFDDNNGEMAKCINWLRNKSLDSISNEQIIDGFDCISFLEPEATRYYLPKWILASINYPDSNACGWTERSIGDLIGSGNVQLSPLERLLYYAFLRWYVMEWRHEALDNLSLQIFESGIDR